MRNSARHMKCMIEAPSRSFAGALWGHYRSAELGCRCNRRPILPSRQQRAGSKQSCVIKKSFQELLVSKSVGPSRNRPAGLSPTRPILVSRVPFFKKALRMSGAFSIDHEVVRHFVFCSPIIHPCGLEDWRFRRSPGLAENGAIASHRNMPHSRDQNSKMGRSLFGHDREQYRPRTRD
jgi:hypothetical protein